MTNGVLMYFLDKQVAAVFGTSSDYVARAFLLDD